MYRKQLEKSQIDQLMTDCGLKEDARAEQLRPEKLVEFANRLYGAIEAPAVTPDNPNNKIDS